MAKKSGRGKRPPMRPPMRPPKRGGRPRGPRSQALPGMEQIRNTKLDHLCESVGEIRDSMNQLRKDEKEEKNAALKVMRAQEITTYQHAGVEFARVPGEEKLRVRRTNKSDATAAVEEPGDAGGDNEPELGETDAGV